MSRLRGVGLHVEGYISPSEKTHRRSWKELHILSLLVRTLRCLGSCHYYGQQQGLNLDCWTHDRIIASRSDFFPPQLPFAIVEARAWEITSQLLRDVEKGLAYETIYLKVVSATKLTVVGCADPLLQLVPHGW